MSKSWESAMNRARASLEENRWDGNPSEPVERFSVTVEFFATMSDAQRVALSLQDATGVRPMLRRLRRGKETR